MVVIVLYLFGFIIDNSSISTTNPKKDTIEYMMTMCHKTEFVRMAIEMNLFNSTQYIWMDLGIKHMMTCSDEEFMEKVMRLKDVEYKLNHIRIPSIWSPDNNYQVDLYKNCVGKKVFRLHRLIAKAFIPNPNNYLIVTLIIQSLKLLLIHLYQYLMMYQILFLFCSLV